MGRIEKQRSDLFEQQTKRKYFFSFPRPRGNPWKLPWKVPWKAVERAVTVEKFSSKGWSRGTNPWIFEMEVLKIN